MYTIDLATLLQLLREFRRSGTLQTVLSSGIPELREPCHGLIELARGEIVSCSIKSNRGRTVVTGENAIRILGGMGVLDWTFDVQQSQSVAIPQGPSLKRPAFPSTALSPIPRRNVQVNARDMRQWPRKYWQVFVLVDGERSIDKIAAILSQPSSIVDEVLQDLRAMGVVEIE